MAFQLVVLAWTLIGHVRRDPSPTYRACWAAPFCGVIGLDVWYLVDFAYPAGFQL